MECEENVWAKNSINILCGFSSCNEAKIIVSFYLISNVILMIQVLTEELDRLV